MNVKNRINWDGVLIVAYIIAATLAYGHSYTNNPYKFYRETQSIAAMNAAGAALLAPAYWLSIVGVAIFEEKK